MKRLLTYIIMTVSFVLTIEGQNKRSVQTLSEWEFRKGHSLWTTDGWQKVNIPHDWAIYGPFDRSNDLQNVAVVQNGEKTASVKTKAPEGGLYS